MGGSALRNVRFSQKTIVQTEPIPQHPSLISIPPRVAAPAAPTKAVTIFVRCDDEFPGFD